MDRPPERKKVRSPVSRSALAAASRTAGTGPASVVAFSAIVAELEPSGGATRSVSATLMSTRELVLLLVFGCALTFSLAVCLSVCLGLVRQVYRWLTISCPHCSQRRLRYVRGIRGRDPGTFYLCAACSRRWFLPEHGQNFQDASSPSLDPYFEPPAPPQGTLQRLVVRVPEDRLRGRQDGEQQHGEQQRQKLIGLEHGIL